MPCLGMGREGRIFRLQRSRVEFRPLLDSCSPVPGMGLHCFPKGQEVSTPGSHSLMGSFVGTTGLPNSGSMDLWSSVPLSSVESAVDA